MFKKATSKVSASSYYLYLTVCVLGLNAVFILLNENFCELPFSVNLDPVSAYSFFFFFFFIYSAHYKAQSTVKLFLIVLIEC